MEKIIWNDSFSVGVAKLDGQHKRITEIINLLMDEPKDGFDSRTVEQILNQLTEYVHNHFETEEKILADLGFPDLHLQHEEHKEFRLELADLCMQAIHGYASIPANLNLYLREWWVDHILVKDMQYRPFLASRGLR
ncbi:MAG TPA: bacteriohemerythrin [Geothrix sp.]|nr:bacteriohemerythrin [Geothrix sp.]